MKEQIYKICTQLNDGQIAVTEATEQLLDLFDVSRSATTDEKEIIDAYMKEAKKYYPKKKKIVL